MLLIVAAAMISLNACGQNARDVPVKVKTGFDQTFPGAEKVTWGKENATEWEAEFTFNSKSYSANYKSDGTWVETEYKIEANEIPAAIANTLNKKYPGYKVTGSEVSETPEGKVYEIAIKTGNKKMKVALHEDGTPVKKEAASERKAEKDQAFPKS